MDTLENEITALREVVEELKEERRPKIIWAIWRYAPPYYLIVDLYYENEDAEKYLVDMYGSLENATNYGYSISKVNIL